MNADCAHVQAEEASDEEAIEIAIRHLKAALRDPEHRGVYVEDARIWIRHL